MSLSRVPAADSIAIPDHLIRDVVEAFYARVRRDSELGPIFEAVLSARWED